MSAFKRFLLFTLFLTFNLTTFAQTVEQPTDIVYLKDGSFLKGTVVTETPFALELKLSDGSTINLSKGNIKQINKLSKNQILFNNGSTVKSKGNYQIVSMALLVGQDINNNGFKSGASVLHYVHGHQFNPYFAIGGGVGVDIYNDLYLPLYLDVRGYLTQKATSPYYALNVGYALPLVFEDKADFFSRKVTGGLMFNPSLGIRFASQNRANYLLEIGYRVQYSTIEYSFDDSVEDWIFQRIAIKGGIEF